MKHFFNSDNFFWKCFDKLADVLCLSLLWFLCCLPVVTVGAATTALYDAVVHTVRWNEPALYSRFFRTFRREFKTAALTWLLWGAVLFLLFAGWNIMSSIAQGSGPLLVLAMVYYVLMVIPLGMLCWLFPLLSRYEFTFSALNRTALQFWFAHLPSTVAMAVLLALCIGLTVQLLYPVVFLPCLLALANSFFVERAFRKHMPEEPPADGEEAS